MSYKLLTNLLFEPRGKHNPSLTYNIKDTVMSEDGSKVYFALDNVPAGIPLTDTNYWMLQMDLSASKNAMDTAAANARTQTDATIASANTRVEDMMGKAADAVTSVADYAAKVGMRVKGETKITKGNPMTIYPDGGSLLKVQTDIPIKQSGSGDPYPAGSRKNLCPPLSGVKTENGVTFTPNADGSVTVSGTATAQSAVGTQQFILKAGTYTVSGGPVGGAIGSYDIYVFKADGTGTIARSYNGINETFTISNDTNVALAMRVPSGTVDTSKVFWPMIEAGSTATKFAPYSNIRPFVGYDELDLNVTGKNLFLVPEESTLNGVTLSKQGDHYVLNGTATASINFKSKLVKLPAGTYTLSANNPTHLGLGNPFIQIYSPTNLEDMRVANNKVNVTTTKTLNGADDYVCRIRVEKGKSYDNFIIQPQLEFGEIATDFVANQSSLHTVQLGRTVCSGRFDWLTGKLTDGIPPIEFDGDEVVSTDGGGIFTTGAFGEASEAYGEILCSHYTSVRDYESFMSTDMSVCVWASGQIRIHDSRFNSVSEINAYYAAEKAAGTPVQFAYKLATPIEIPLAPNVITAIEDGGMNTIYGDGDIQVEYVKPLSESIKERTDILLDAFSESFETSGSIIQCEPIGNWPFDSVVTEFSPKQEGGGDPYPAGGGKNLLNNTATTQTVNGVTFTVNADGTVTANGTATANAYFYIDIDASALIAGTEYILSGCPDGGSTSTYRVAIQYYDSSNALKFFGNDTGDGSKFTRPEAMKSPTWFIVVLGGMTVSNLIFKPMIRLASNPDATYAPYSNIRPITGYDALELNHTGKNLFTGWIRGGKINSIMGAFEITSDAARTGYIPVVPSKQIEISGLTDTLYNFVAFYDEAKNFVSRSNAVALNAVTIRTPDNCAYIAITQYENVNVTGTITGLKDTVQIEYGTSVTEYTPHAGMDTYTVQIGKTVYGGKFDWLTGKLADDVCLYELNISDMNNEDAYPGWRGVPGLADIVGVGLDTYMNVSGGFVASNISADAVAFGVNTRNGNETLFLSIEYFGMTQSEWKARHPDLKVQLACVRKHPIEIQLTPTEIIALTGVNTLYGDGDTITAKFRQSKDVDILKRLSALETLMTNQTKGE